MTAENFDQIMDWLAVYEGGKVDDKDDPGGRTNRGVIQRVYDAYRRAHGLAKRDVYLMTDDEHDDIYLEQYWRPVWGNRLPSGVDAAMYDYAVNSGVSRSVKVTQRIVGVEPDGVMGNVTFAAIMDYCAEKSAAELCVAICTERLAFMKRLKVWWKYKNGWTRRVMGKHAGVQSDDLGVIDRSVMLTRGTKLTIPPPKAPTPGKAPDGAMGLLGLILNIIAAIFGRRIL